MDWSFQLRGATADVVVASPVTIDLGAIIPKKRNLPIQVVKLVAKKNARTLVMKSSNTGFYPLKEFVVFDEKVRPEPARSGNGHWIMPIPKALEPGEYAVISDGDIWEFAVKI